MNYLLFNNAIFIGDGVHTRRIEKDGGLKNILGSIQKADICVVDVDVLIASAVESPIEMKDSLLVRKFNEAYPQETYMIQDEKIDNNLFQVIGIKEQKVREIYSLMPPEKVGTFVPYGIALRHLLKKSKVDLDRTVVFVDDLGRERLLTVFEGLKFSRTRIITSTDEDLLPEIKRSQIDFSKKNEEYSKNEKMDFVIVVNDQTLAGEISRNEEHLPVEYLNIAYPALAGLKEVDTAIKYILPEKIIEKRKAAAFKKSLAATALSVCIVAFGLLYFLFCKIEMGLVRHHYDLAAQTNAQLAQELTLLDRETYRTDLKSRKILNYGISYLTVLGLIPASYAVDAFKFIKLDHWNLEVSLFAENGDTFDRIPNTGILKNADIKDIFVNNQPGKHLRVSL
jgi:hypothetical protein